ncbi:MAG: hypothetical protein Kow0025_24800 [Thermodesulfovibrionales bacterium]
MTLVELIATIAIVGILVAAFGFSFAGWREKYRVESEVKEIYADLMNARARAMQRGRVHFVNVPAATSNAYQIFEDTNPAPDGDGVLDGSDALIKGEETFYAIDASGLGVTTFNFNRDGLASVSGSLRLLRDEAPDYDCITLETTRINMGVWDDASSTCDAK